MKERRNYFLSCRSGVVLCPGAYFYLRRKLLASFCFVVLITSLFFMRRLSTDKQHCLKIIVFCFFSCALEEKKHWKLLFKHSRIRCKNWKSAITLGSHSEIYLDGIWWCFVEISIKFQGLIISSQLFVLNIILEYNWTNVHVYWGSSKEYIGVCRSKHSEKIFYSIIHSFWMHE